MVLVVCRARNFRLLARPRHAERESFGNCDGKHDLLAGSLQHRFIGGSKVLENILTVYISYMA